MTLPVQVNGKVRFTIEVPASADRDTIAELLTRHPAYPPAAVARLIIVPGTPSIARGWRHRRGFTHPAGQLPGRHVLPQLDYVLLFLR